MGRCKDETLIRSGSGEEPPGSNVNVGLFDVSCEHESAHPCTHTDVQDWINGYRPIFNELTTLLEITEKEVPEESMSEALKTTVAHAQDLRDRYVARGWNETPWNSPLIPLIWTPGANYEEITLIVADMRTANCLIDELANALDRAKIDRPGAGSGKKDDRSAELGIIGGLAIAGLIFFTLNQVNKKKGRKKRSTPAPRGGYSLP